MALNRFTAALLILLPLTAVTPPAQAAQPTVQTVSQLFRQGKTSQALEKIEAYLAANPRDAQGRFLKGLIQTDLGQTSEAIKTFDDLTNDYPELPEPYNNLAVLYAAQGDYERAKNSLEMAIRTHPSYATAHENLGDIYAKMASMAYDKALQLDQGNSSAQTKLGLIRDLFVPQTAQTAVATGAKPITPAVAQAPAAKEAGPAATATQASADPEVVDAPPPPPANPESDEALTVALQAWARAWSNKDLAAYLSAYATEYVPDGLDRATWEAQRKQRLSKPRFIRVEIDQIQIARTGLEATVDFRQRYQSDRYRDLSRKQLTMALQDGQWKITGER